MAAKFEKFSISPEFPLSFRKSHQILKNYLKSFESYRQKTLEGSLKTPLGLNRVKSEFDHFDLDNSCPTSPLKGGNIVD